jgi:hypothetical protein
MGKKKLYPGIGAEGTHFMKPKQRIANKDHQSSVVLQEHYFEGRCLFFRFVIDSQRDVLYASS